jgi:hypothetical protein
MTTLGPITRVWTVKLYRDDSTTPIVYSDVKHVFWTADNSVFVIAQFTDGPGQEAHHYIHWPRERVCWYRLERHSEPQANAPHTPPLEQTS